MQEGGIPIGVLDTLYLRLDCANDPLQADLDLGDYCLQNTGCINFDLDATPGHAEGRMHWDDDSGTAELGMKGGTVNLQIGQEHLIRVKADENIANGEVVYITGADGTNVTVAKAQANAAPQFRAVGMATEDIGNNQQGYITIAGIVRELDTSSFSDGDTLYLSGTVAGGVQNTLPDSDTYYIVVIGHVCRDNNGEGEILVNMVHFPDTDHIFQLDAWGDGRYPSRAEWGQNGFNAEGSYNTDSVMTFTDGTRTFSIQPSGVASFDYWVLGIKYTTTGDTVVIGDGDTGDEGIWVIWYNGSTLTATQNPNDGQVSAVIRTGAICAILYWNATDEEIIYFGEERHGKVMSPSVHAYLHFIEGLRYMYGLALNTITPDENGSAASHAQFGVDSGAVSDEDIYEQSDAVAAATGLPIVYMLGDEANPRWVKYEQAGYSCRTADGTANTRLAYNQNNAGTWQLTEESNGDFVLYHIFATTEKDKPMVSIMGQNGYATKGQAREGAETEIHNLVLNNVLFPEIRPIATVIFQTKLSYADPVNARIVSTDEGDAYIDWRSTVLSRVEASTDVHGNLSGLTNDDHTQYILTDGTRAFTGAVTIGADEAGFDFKAWATSAGEYMEWDASASELILAGTSKAEFSGNFDIGLTGDTDLIQGESGQVTINGNLITDLITIEVFNQSGEPTTGDIPAGNMAFWTDTDDSKCYLCYNHSGTVKTAELT